MDSTSEKSCTGSIFLAPEQGLGPCTGLGGLPGLFQGQDSVGMCTELRTAGTRVREDVWFNLSPGVEVGHTHPLQ